MSDRPQLRRLADRAGILPEYTDITGETRTTDDETRVALLAAMGFDASGEAEAEAVLRSLERREKRRILPPGVVARRRPGRTLEVPIRLPEGWPLAADHAVELVHEDGRIHEARGRIRASAKTRVARLRLDAGVGTGYHRLRLELKAHGERAEAETRLIVVPDSCYGIEESSGGRDLFGLWTNLYTVRSDRNWGIGDLGDLDRLLEWAAGIGAAFVGINPVHALRNRGHDISPYRPLSRLFRNILYIDVTAVPELAICPEARDRLRSDAFRDELRRVRSSDHVLYEAVLDLKTSILRELHAAFRDRDDAAGTERDTRYRDYLEKRGEALVDFATFSALQEHFRREGEGAEPGNWPSPYRDAGSEAVAAFRAEHRDEIDFHRYLQFELDRQMAEAAERAAALELPLGLYGDLAIGASPGGADSWAYPELFTDGAHIGAPPDDYSPTGQDWGLPPIDPLRLREDGYRYWIRLVQNALAHVGALRIDHVMGLYRQYWVPADRSATRGAYIRYPADELIGILALESRRREAVIIGEDLGTVPRGLPSRLARRGILSSQVLYFERDGRGRFRRASRYSPRALVTVNTHDHPPLRGFWEGRDLEIRHRVGALPDDRSLASAREERSQQKTALLDRLRRSGVLEGAEEPHRYPELCAAVHAFLAKTPAPLVGVSLDDLTGETEPVNLPGVGLDRYPSWSRCMSEPLESLPDDPDVARALAGLRNRRA